ncbi:MAG: hypothetical protein EWM72_03488 [Nitrospira sp.]|nr:MAG: hypothetical protein EWM72_03488 [Nitrospira sp.]
MCLYGQFYDSEALAPLFRMPQVILSLLIHPAFSSGVKGHGETHSHFRADPCSTIQNGRKGLAAYSQRFGCLGHSDAQWFKAERLNDFTRTGWIVHAHGHQLFPKRFLTQDGFLRQSNTACTRTSFSSKL